MCRFFLELKWMEERERARDNGRKCNWNRSGHIPPKRTVRLVNTLVFSNFPSNLSWFNCQVTWFLHNCFDEAISLWAMSFAAHSMGNQEHCDFVRAYVHHPTPRRLVFTLYRYRSVKRLFAQNEISMRACLSRSLRYHIPINVFSKYRKWVIGNWAQWVR